MKKFKIILNLKKKLMTIYYLVRWSVIKLNLFVIKILILNTENEQFTTTEVIDAYFKQAVSFNPNL